MTQKNKRILARQLGAVILALHALSSPLGSRAAEHTGVDRPATQTNPALLYWQAFALMDQYSQAHKLEGESVVNGPFTAPYLATSEQEYQAYVDSLDVSFRLLRRGAESDKTCDWGIDYSPGITTVFTHFSKAKAMAHRTRYRAHFFLKHGNEQEAVKDLLATWKLARDVAMPPTLTAFLLRSSMEQILTGFVAAHFGHFDNEAIRTLSKGLESLPSKPRYSEIVKAQQDRIIQPFIERVRAFKKRPGNNGEKLRVLLEGMPSGTIDRVVKWSNGSLEVMQHMLLELNEAYPELAETMDLPLADFDKHFDKLQARLEAKGNPLMTRFLPAFKTCKRRGVHENAKLAMLKAAIQYRLGGVEAFRQVPDPYGEGSFDIRSITRTLGAESIFIGDGFQLTSDLVAQMGRHEGDRLGLVFLEKNWARKGATEKEEANK